MGKYLSVLLVLLLTGCERLLIAPRPPATSVSTFTTVWQTLNNQYPFFELKGVDWKAVYNQYRPQVTGDASDQTLAQTLADMLRQLRDGHVKLLTPGTEYSYDWARNVLPNFTPTTVAKYFNGQFLQSGKPLFHALIAPDVAYIYCPNFQNPGLTDAHLTDLANTYTNRRVTNVIVDLRDNTGGLYANANRLISMLISQKTVVGYERYRADTTPNRYTRWYSLRVLPHTSPFTGKIIVLTNRRVFSAANYVVAALKGLPGVTIIGDQTGGGGASIHYTELPNGWRLSFPVSQYANRAYALTEAGVMPDLRLDLLPEDNQRGKDTLLEAALSRPR